MRAAALALILPATPAAADPADYATAYRQARTRALAYTVGYHNDSR